MRKILAGIKIQHVAAAGIILLLVIGNAAPVDDPDVWWHLKVGQDIWAQGEIPVKDAYSFSNAGHTWVAHEWLAEVLYGQVYATSGYQGLLVFNITVISLTLFLLYKVMMDSLGERKAAALAMLIVAAVLNSVFWMFRPHIPAYLLFAGFIFLLYREKKFRKGICLLPFLMILWVNIHGSYILGIWLAGIYLLSGTVRLEIGRMVPRPMDRNRKKTTVAVLAAIILAVFVNPNTYHMFLYPFQTVNSEMITSNVLEWLSPDFHQKRMALFLAYIMFTYGILAISRERIYIDEMVNMLAFTALSMFGARNLALFVFISLPVMARHLKGLLGQPVKRVNMPFVNWAAVLLTLALTVVFWPFARTLEDNTGKGEFPQAALQYMEKHSLKGNIFNDYDWGGYLIWKGYPDFRVFVDGRADIYADRVIPDYVTIMSAGKESYRVFESYNTDYALLRRDEPFAALLSASPGWSRIYRDETAVIFARVR